MAYRIAASGLILLILAIATWYLCFYAPPLKISPETTYITAPLMSDGKRIDYFRAWEERAYPPEMKTDDNGYRILVRAIGDPTKHGSWDEEDNGCCPSSGLVKKFDPEPFRLQVYEKLGLDPTIPPTLKLEGADTHVRCCVQGLPEPEDLRLWENWLAENGAGIDLLGEAVRKPVFQVPIVRTRENRPLLSGLLEPAHTLRMFARALQARANYRIGIGDIDGAIEDTLTCYHLARHTGKQGGTTYHLVGIAIEGMATAIPIGGNPEAPPSREQLQRLFDAICSLPPLQKLEDCYEQDRFLTLNILQEYAFGGKPKIPDTDGIPERGLWSFAVDWNRVFRVLNKRIDALIAGELDIETNLEATENFWSMLTVRGRTKVATKRFSSGEITTQPHIREIEHRRQCFENMRLLTLALLLYEKDHGKLPDGDWREALKTTERAGGASPPVMHQDSPAGLRPPLFVFQCPSHPGLADDETTYAMIRRESGEVPTTPYTLLLVEVHPPMKMTGNDGTIPEALARFNRTEDGQPTDGLDSNHSGGCNVSYRSGAVAFISRFILEEELQSHIDGTAYSP